MKRTEILQNNGKTTFYMDFSGLKNENDIAELIEEGKLFIRTQPPKSIFTLSNVDDMHFNIPIKDLFTEFIKGNSTYVKAGAVIGVSGLIQIVLNGIMKVTGRNFRSFGDIESAKNWLNSH